MQLVQVFGLLLTLPPLRVDLVVGRVGSDDVTQRDCVSVFWRKSWINPEFELNSRQTFCNYGNCYITDQCRRGSPSLFRFYCPQLSPFIVPPMCSFPDVAGSCFTAEKKNGNHPNISVICLAPNGMQISNKLKSNFSKSKHSSEVFVEIKQKR